MWIYQDWNIPYGKPKGDPLTTRAAEQRFEEGERLMMLSGGNPHPQVVLRIERGGKLIDATWLDQLRRPVVTYIWTQPFAHEPKWPMDRLLLQQAATKIYLDKTPPPECRASEAETYLFKPDGSFSAHRVNNLRGESFKSSGVSLDALQTEKIPAFGAWAPFLDRDRILS